MSGRVLDRRSIMCPGNGWFRVRLDAALEQQSFTVVFLSNGWLLCECWRNAVDLSNRDKEVKVKKEKIFGGGEEFGRRKYEYEKTRFVSCDPFLLYTRSLKQFKSDQKKKTHIKIFCITPQFETHGSTINLPSLLAICKHKRMRCVVRINSYQVFVQFDRL